MPATTADRRAAPADAGPLLRSHAFGLDIESDFAAPGLPEDSSRSRGLRPTRLVCAPNGAVDARWQPAAPARLLEEEFGGGRPARTIDHDGQLGYRLYARHFGLALIAADGREVLCEPPPVAAWRWQRFLVGRV